MNKHESAHTSFARISFSFFLMGSGPQHRSNSRKRGSEKKRQQKMNKKRRKEAVKMIRNVSEWIVQRQDIESVCLLRENMAATLFCLELKNLN